MNETSSDSPKNVSQENLKEPSLESLSLGQIFQKRRQDLKMELSDACSYLAVKLRDIQALENDNVEKITAHTYVAGLIKSYGRLLKIDEKIIEKKIRLLSIRSNVENKKHLLINIGENNELTPNRDNVLNFAAISLLMLIVLFLAYNSYESNNNLITNRKLIIEMEALDG